MPDSFGFENVFNAIKPKGGQPSDILLALDCAARGGRIVNGTCIVEPPESAEARKQLQIFVKKNEVMFIDLGKALFQKPKLQLFFDPKADLEVVWNCYCGSLLPDGKIMAFNSDWNVVAVPTVADLPSYSSIQFSSAYGPNFGAYHVFEPLGAVQAAPLAAAGVQVWAGIMCKSDFYLAIVKWS